MDQGTRWLIDSDGENINAGTFVSKVVHLFVIEIPTFSNKGELMPRFPFGSRIGLCLNGRREMLDNICRPKVERSGKQAYGVHEVLRCGIWVDAMICEVHRQTQRFSQEIRCFLRYGRQGKCWLTEAFRTFARKGGGIESNLSQKSGENSLRSVDGSVLFCTVYTDKIPHSLVSVSNHPMMPSEWIFSYSIVCTERYNS